MAKVIFKLLDGNLVTVDDASGNLMELAQEHQIDGIDGDCGGVCSCSTCHVYVDPAWVDKVPAPEELETDTLEFNSHQKPNSRLSCQIELTEDLDGLVVEVAPAE